MREILFRGKRIYNGLWAYGNLVIDKNGKPHIVELEVVEEDGHHVAIDSDVPMFIDPETVGQFTGLTDKNGKKIFEGDIINFSNPRPFKDFVAEVAFDDGCFDLVNKSRCFRDYLKCYTCNHVGEVIGNRWDNPELLEGVE